jgi:SSS family solute:Na+ symporter
MAAMIGIGLYSRSKIKNATDYHLAGRRLGVIMMAGTLAATEIGGGSSVGVASKAFGSWGLSAGWYVVCAGIGIFLVSFIAPQLRKSMATTVPEIIGRRYGSLPQTLTAILGFVALIALAAVQITATATIVTALTGFPAVPAIIITGIGVVFYTWLGGMWSVTLTDFVQFFFIVFGFAAALPFALAAAGGWGTVVSKLPPEQLGFTKIGWPTIIGLIVLYFMTFSTGQEAVQRYYSARTPKVAVAGSVLCAVLMTAYAFIPALLGLIAKAEFPTIAENSALATVATQMLHPVFAGILLSAVMSATLSSASGDLLGAGTIWVKDLHPKIFGALTEAQELGHSKMTVAIVGLAATLLAVFSQQIIPLLVFAFTMRSAGPFSAFIFGLIWDKTSRMAALWSIIVGTVVGVGWQVANGFDFAGTKIPPIVPGGIQFFGWKVDPIIPGALASLAVFLIIHSIDRARGNLVGDSVVVEYSEISK